jgi:hypothetical protein
LSSAFRVFVSRLQNQPPVSTFKQRRFCVTDPLDCTFPWYYTCLQSQSGASPDNRPLVASMVVQIIYSCRNPYRRRSGLLFLDSRISHQSELSGKSLSFSAVVQNTWRLSLLRKLGDRLDLDIHRYHINTPISHRLIWLCALLYPSLATSAAQIRYAAQMSGVGTVRLQRGLLNVCPQSISYLSDLKLPCQFL